MCFESIGHAKWVERISRLRRLAGIIIISTLEAIDTSSEPNHSRSGKKFQLFIPLLFSRYLLPRLTDARHPSLLSFSLFGLFFFPELTLITSLLSPSPSLSFSFSFSPFLSISLYFWFPCSLAPSPVSPASNILSSSSRIVVISCQRERLLGISNTHSHLLSHQHTHSLPVSWLAHFH